MFSNKSSLLRFVLFLIDALIFTVNGVVFTVSITVKAIRERRKNDYFGEIKAKGTNCVFVQ